MHEVRGVVVREKGAPATVETILVPDPGPGEALVDVITCGVCQTDQHYQAGAVGGEFPYRACHKGQPWYCFATHNATQKMTLTDGTELSPALGIGAFIEKTLVAAGQCTKIEGEVRPEQYAALGLLGCG